MYIRLMAGTVATSDEFRPGVVFDLNAEGKVLGIEMLDVSLLSTDNLFALDLRFQTSHLLGQRAQEALLNVSH